ncbi:unnamed protein product [Spirodela intermedia]|uniref:O-fucosyltransferase family protein n=1 Tax=Spirodela intermedia TaxID=51605 RepID=A0A7I8JNS4_SPIIN|nr:unnamed protein product [Spirodela intermedia]CAA6671799.1 unnamed protein product [Spirodela intermedia]
MMQRSSIKLAAIVGIGFSVASLIVHLYLANFSSSEYLDDGRPFDGFYGSRFKFARLWGPIGSLEFLQPYANPREEYPVPGMENNGYLYAKIYGGFENIQSSICDLVAIARLLNATLVIPEIQESLQSKGVSSKFKSFSYIYDEKHFIAALTKDVIVVRSLPAGLKEAKKKNELTMISPKHSASPSFYLDQSILPPTMAEYQRLRCRVAFLALQFRPEIKALGKQIINRLRTFEQPYIAYHPGIIRDTLAFHGCAELFQDVHTELIQYRRKQMIKRGILNEKLEVDSRLRRRHGSCPLMPEEVGLLLRAIGYPSNTVIYLAGSEIFGGPRILIPLHAMYPNVVDRTSLCSQKELSHLVGPESPLPEELFPPLQLQKAGPRPRPLPPPPARQFYPHERSGWYGWVTAVDSEPNPSPGISGRKHTGCCGMPLTIWSPLLKPGHGHRLFRMPTAVTYRPDRKIITELFDTIRDNLYHPRRNWTVNARSQMSKPTSFLSHPLPECSCRISAAANISVQVEGIRSELSSESEEECPAWMPQDHNPPRDVLEMTLGKRKWTRRLRRCPKKPAEWMRPTHRRKRRLSLMIKHHKKEHMACWSYSAWIHSLLCLPLDGRCTKSRKFYVTCVGLEREKRPPEVILPHMHVSAVSRWSMTLVTSS